MSHAKIKLGSLSSNLTFFGLNKATKMSHSIRPLSGHIKQPCSSIFQLWVWVHPS